MLPSSPCHRRLRLGTSLERRPAATVVATIRRWAWCSRATQADRTRQACRGTAKPARPRPAARLLTATGLQCTSEVPGIDLAQTCAAAGRRPVPRPRRRIRFCVRASSLFSADRRASTLDLGALWRACQRPETGVSFRTGLRVCERSGRLRLVRDAAAHVPGGAWRRSAASIAIIAPAQPLVRLPGDGVTTGRVKRVRRHADLIR